MADSGPRPVVGPVPQGEDPEAYDKRRRRVLWSMPAGLYVVGSRAGGRRNLMTLSWATQVATEPKLVAIGVERQALTHRLVAEGGVFSLCLVARGDRAIVRRFVKPVEDGSQEELAGFPVRTATTGAPILVRAAAWLDCELRQSVALGSHTLFVGEVVDAGAGVVDAGAGVVDAGAGVVDAGAGSAENLEVLRMEDTRMSYGG